MAQVLYVTSTESRTGKTALAASLVAGWQEAGRKAEYLRLARGSSSGDEEFLFARQALGLGGEPDQPSIISVGASSAEAALEQLAPRVEKASADADVVVIESPEEFAGISPAIVEALQAKALLVVRYVRGMETDQVLTAAQPYGDSLAGVVVNAVPKLGWRIATTEFSPALIDAGVQVLGMVPESRVSLGITVDSLVERLGAQYAFEGENGSSLVENFLIGANVLDAAGYPAGPLYFGRMEQKAVIAKGDRPDFHWAAMDADTLCVILTGNHQPIPYVLEKAKETKVPLAVVEKDTLDTMAEVEQILAEARLDAPVKLERLRGLFAGNVDLDAINSALGI
jgi:BioD-like phosphotransacetylase family protein